MYAQILAEHATFMNEKGSNDPSDSLRDRVSELEAEVARLRGQLSQAKHINDTMWETITQKVLVPNSSSGHGQDIDMVPLEDDARDIDMVRSEGDARKRAET
jgi:pre-rRNA-processing protein IPI3